MNWGNEGFHIQIRSDKASVSFGQSISDCGCNVGASRLYTRSTDSRRVISGHRVSPEKLLELDRDLSKIAIITGDLDGIVNPQRSRDLHGFLPVRLIRLVSERDSFMTDENTAQRIHLV